MNLHRGILALCVVGALTNQASAQFFPFFGLGGLGGFGGGYPSFGGYSRGGMGSSFPYGSYYGGFRGGMSYPTIWTNAPFTAYTSATTITQPVIPPNSPLSLDPNFDNWAYQHGYYLRPGEAPPRFRNSLYPATPVDASDWQAGNRAHIQVIVPSNGATVLFDGVAMRQTGTVRNFMTPPLEAGKDYAFNIQVQDGGQTLNQMTDVRPGDEKTIDFTKDR
jgi:uncharacterized protein (TIGR03000 family)